MLGYHFTNGVLRGGGAIPPIGEWLVHEGEIKPGESGLPACETVLGALADANGASLHRVELDGDLMPASDKRPGNWTGRRRRVLWTLDATGVLQAFGRWCASEVVDQWDAPAVARDWLASGDPALLDETWRAAWSASRYAGLLADEIGAWSAVRGAMWSAARSASRSAAEAASAYLDGYAVSSAVRAAARFGGRHSSRAAQGERLAAMVEDAMASKEL